MAIVAIIAIAILRWLDKSYREDQKRRAEFEKRCQDIENAITRQWESPHQDFLHQKRQQKK